MHYADRKAFTLIELLVVIAIIAILAAILFPVFSHAKMKANLQKCGVHGRELGQAMMMYMDDNNAHFPSTVPQALIDKVAAQKGTWTYNWPGTPWVDTWTVCGTNYMRYISLANYVRNNDIWICPSPTGLYGMKYAYGYRCSWFFLDWKWCYDTNYPDTPFQTWYGFNDARNGVGRTLTDVLGDDMKLYKRYMSPSSKIIASCFALGPDVPVEAYNGGPIVTPYYPHMDGSTYVYADGHARWKETGRGWAPVGYTNSSLDRPHK